MEEGTRFKRNVDIFKHGLSFETQPQVKFIREPKIFHLALTPESRSTILPIHGRFLRRIKIWDTQTWSRCMPKPYLGAKYPDQCLSRYFMNFRSAAHTYTNTYKVPQDSFLHGFVGLKIKFMTTCQS